MRNQEHFFAEDVEIPEIVMQKAETAFQKIKMEDVGIVNINKHEGINQNKKRKGIWRSQAAAVACVCLLAVGSVSVVAAVHHFWSPGMKETLQATDKQIQTLTDKGVASVFLENGKYKDMAVTDGNVTVTPETIIADDKFALVSFSVKGYTVKDHAEPGFGTVNAYLGENSKADEAWVNMEGSFYNGKLSDGSLEYVLRMTVDHEKDSLLGKTVHVGFKDLGVLTKGKCTVALPGRWNLKMDLPSVSSATNISVKKNIPNTVFELDSIEMSPISIKMNYTVNGKVTTVEDDNGLPEFVGVVMKNGTRLSFVGNGGMTEYTDDTKKSAYVLSPFDRVIDTRQVASVLVRTAPDADLVEIPVK